MSNVRRLGALLVAPAALLVIAVWLTWPGWRGHFAWATDSVFYEAQTLELRGQPAPEARAKAIGLYAAAEPTARQLRAFSDREWVAKAAPNYRRRWFVPALAAVVYPVLGVKSLLYVSLVGLLAAVLCLYALARRRFSRAASFLGVAAVLCLSELPNWSRWPLTDSWGLAMLAASLLVATLVIDRGKRWLPVWIAAMALLSTTRDAAMVVLFGVLVCWLCNRARTLLLLLLSGAAAASVAPLIFGASYRDALAYQLSGTYPPDHPSWSYDLHRYLPALRSMLRSDFSSYVSAGQGRPIAVVFLIGCTSIASLVFGGRFIRARVMAGAVGLGFVVLTTLLDFISGGGAPVLPIGVLILTAPVPLLLNGVRDPFFVLQAAAGIGAFAYLALLPSFTYFRFEIVLLAVCAVGAAAWAEQLKQQATSALSARSGAGWAPGFALTRIR
jgi:hypothetical protein